MSQTAEFSFLSPFAKSPRDFPTFSLLFQGSPFQNPLTHQYFDTSTTENCKTIENEINETQTILDINSSLSSVIDIKSEEQDFMNFAFLQTETESQTPTKEDSNSLFDDISNIFFGQEIESSKAKKKVNLSIEVPSIENKKAVLLNNESIIKTESPIESNIKKRATKRTWVTTFVSDEYKDSLEVDITSKTRCENPMNEVPLIMYSSLKYEIRQKAKGSLCESEQFLHSKINVVDSVDYKDIKKDNGSILKGTVEAALTKPPQNEMNEFKGTLKAQFTDVSYHHKKKDFCWQISYFLPSNLDVPILIKRSAPFKVLARKPCQNKKRKRNESENNALCQINSLLDELIRTSKKLKPDEKQSASSILLKKLSEIDPSLLSSLGTNNITNSTDSESCFFDLY